MKNGFYFVLIKSFDFGGDLAIKLKLNFLSLLLQQHTILFKNNGNDFNLLHKL